VDLVAPQTASPHSLRRAGTLTCCSPDLSRAGTTRCVRRSSTMHRIRCGVFGFPHARLGNGSAARCLRWRGSAGRAVSIHCRCEVVDRRLRGLMYHGLRLALSALRAAGFVGSGNLAVFSADCYALGLRRSTVDTACCLVVRSFGGQALRLASATWSWPWRDVMRLRVVFVEFSRQRGWRDGRVNHSQRPDDCWPSGVGVWCGACPTSAPGHPYLQW